MADGREAKDVFETAFEEPTLEDRIKLGLTVGSILGVMNYGGLKLTKRLMKRRGVAPNKIARAERGGAIAGIGASVGGGSLAAGSYQGRRKKK